jgi:hypothetical protein
MHLQETAVYTVYEISEVMLFLTGTAQWNVTLCETSKLGTYLDERKQALLVLLLVYFST